MKTALVSTSPLSRILEREVKAVELVNALSLNMLPLGVAATRQFTLITERITLEETVELLGVYPVHYNSIGHPETDAIIRNLLHAHGIEVPEGERRQVDLMTWIDGYPLLVAQYVGPRLPEGVTELPPGTQIQWVLVAARSGPYHCKTCSDYSGRGGCGGSLLQVELAAAPKK